MRKIASTLLAQATRLQAKPFNLFSSTAKYPFLAELGLSEHNEGAYYNGKWQTTDHTNFLNSVNPATEEIIASTKTASLKDYEKAI
jgi:hypothetical protein